MWSDFRTLAARCGDVPPFAQVAEPKYTKILYGR